MLFRVPDMYKIAVDKVYEVEDGVCCKLSDGWRCGADKVSVIQCKTYTDLRAELRSIQRM